jgi:uracil-DNA glycosylase family 4
MANRIREFFRQVADCHQCYPGNEIAVPMPPDGARLANIRVVIVGEQPHRPSALGSGLLDIEKGDATVGRLRDYLKETGLSRSEVLYTTAVMCVPKDEKLRPDRPSFREARHCSRHLRRLFEVVRPNLIVPLGHTAIQAVQCVYQDWTELRQFILNYDVGRVLVRPDVTVYPLYMTSSDTLRARHDSKQRKDWQRIPSILKSADRRAAVD